MSRAHPSMQSRVAPPLGGHGWLGRTARRRHAMATIGAKIAASDRGVQHGPACSESTPVCETCHGRPKMDRCDCFEECWHSGRYSQEQAYRAMTPRQRREFHGEQILYPWETP